jgi:PTH1 family peptidyl-tRNA hydrolase
VGEFRFRANGSAGGHNGISSIIEQTGTENFPRLKLGIGPLPKFSKTPDFVLSNFNEDDKQKTEILLKSVKNIFDLIIDDGFDKAVSKISGGKQK